MIGMDKRERERERVCVSGNSVLSAQLVFSPLLRAIDLMSRVFANGLGARGSVPGRVIAKALDSGLRMLKKWYLMPPCLTLNIIRQGSSVKWSNPEVAPSLHLGVVAMEKRAFGSASTNVINFTYFFLAMSRFGRGFLSRFLKETLLRIFRRCQK